MVKRSYWIVWIAILAAATARAEPTCFTGGGHSGSLTFVGAVEGEEFTGRFGEFDVEYCLDARDPAAGAIRVDVGLASADSGNDDRDQTLMGSEFFAVDEHPQARWRSAGIAADGDGFRADGELTLKGITRSQAIRFIVEPRGEDLVVRGRFTMAGSAELDRQRWEIGTGDFADPEFVRNRVDVAFEVTLSTGSGS